MRVGLFISEFKDEHVAYICRGADEAACKLGIKLIIFPGKYMITDRNIDESNPYAYQYQAVFDYAMQAKFDGFIVDIDRIGRDAQILKKEDFIKSLDNKNVLTLTTLNGFESVESEDDLTDEELGFYAIKQLYEKISGKKSDIEKSKLKDITLKDITESILKLQKISEIITFGDIQEKYSIVSEKVAEAGIENIELAILEEPVNRSLKKGWKIPKKSKRIFSVKDGKSVDVLDNDSINTKDIFDIIDNNNSQVIRNIFIGNEQKGFMITDYSKDFMCGVFDDILLDTLIAGGRIDYLLKNTAYLEEELADCQEQLARDGSVLDHIGDKDYLTGLPNRRGFFAEAYDMLKEEFKEGKYAVVAYIDMDSLKNINAIHGHDEGDHAVCRVAEILEEVFGKHSVCGRIRGDEFAVIQVTDEEDKAEALRIEMARQNNKLLMDNTKYLNHLIYSICEFDYEKSLSLREMLRETDDNLKNMKRLESLG
ncbi:GGDEF domain-containing protein [Butyrivibrio sp. NC2002]|uniref:GGDEF domain-containing protein n=1 Tax=Butyrivibrio sp. NC2002 TaxID=1410610 RepID=UPI00055E607B|nr:GGDEF domain-containing protein [Butyrivibrio sp. NC2002]